MNHETFHDSVVIVTGASAGIGRALASQLAEQGACLSLAARNAERLEAIAGECQVRGGEVLVVPTDVGIEEQCIDLIKRTVERYGRLDMLINNAGMGIGGSLADLPDLELFKRVIDVNFWGMVYCTYHSLPHLKRSRGRIVAVSSLGGKIALPMNTSYIASKHAIQGFYDSLRMELAVDGISVTVVSPYLVVTEFHERFLDAEGRPAGKTGRSIYTRRIMTAEACAKIILRATARRKREVVMWPGPLAAWVKLIAPGLLDRLVVETFLKPAIRRMQSTQQKGDL